MLFALPLLGLAAVAGTAAGWYTLGAVLDLDEVETSLLTVLFGVLSAAVVAFIGVYALTRVGFFALLFPPLERTGQRVLAFGDSLIEPFVKLLESVSLRVG